MQIVLWIIAALVIIGIIKSILSCIGDFFSAIWEFIKKHWYFFLSLLASVLCTGFLSGEYGISVAILCLIAYLLFKAGKKIQKSNWERHLCILKNWLDRPSFDPVELALDEPTSPKYLSRLPGYLKRYSYPDGKNIRQIFPDLLDEYNRAHAEEHCAALTDWLNFSATQLGEVGAEDIMRLSDFPLVFLKYHYGSSNSCQSLLQVFLNQCDNALISKAEQVIYQYLYSQGVASKRDSIDSAWFMFGGFTRSQSIPALCNAAIEADIQNRKLGAFNISETGEEMLQCPDSPEKEQEIISAESLGLDL